LGENPKRSFASVYTNCSTALERFNNYGGLTKDREEWFSLGENHEKVLCFGLHQLFNRFTEPPAGRLHPSPSKDASGALASTQVRAAPEALGVREEPAGQAGHPLR
jgi:hypothetical protein